MRAAAKPAKSCLTSTTRTKAEARNFKISNPMLWLSIECDASGTFQCHDAVHGRTRRQRRTPYGYKMHATTSTDRPTDRLEPLQDEVQPSPHRLAAQFLGNLDTPLSSQLHLHRPRWLWSGLADHGAGLCVAAPARRKPQGTHLDPAACRSDGYWQCENKSQQQPHHRLCCKCDGVRMRCQDVQQWYVWKSGMPSVTD
jgi:hypothetical protein